MALTRANVEAILIRRLGGIFEAVGLDGATVDGSNEDLNDPIGWALRQLGKPTADPTAVSDADVAAVGADDYDALFDLAEWRALETAHGAAVDLVDLTTGPRTERLSDIATAIERKAARLREALAARGLGPAVETVTAGVWSLDFAEKSE
jgi:hypothetical protein